MGKRRHWIILAVWAAVLAVVVVLFGDRVFPSRGDRPDPRVQGPGESKSADSPQAQLHQALRAKNPGYNGNGKFLEQDGKVVVADLSATGIVDLSPLSGSPLNALDLKDNPLSDLTPLKGMALQKLALESTKVTDLRPLSGMPLAELYMNNAPVGDLSGLRGMPLQSLNLYGTAVVDLAPLAGMPLKLVWLNGTPVKDISPLRGCPLVSLTVERTLVADLSPLAGSRLERLHIGHSAVTDLTPIRGLPLTRLVFTPGQIRQGLEIARSMQTIQEIGTSTEGRMPPSVFWQLYDKGNLPQDR